jgi:phosphate transport system substrate-binding protein
LRNTKFLALTLGLASAAVLTFAACGGSTSDSDKTATAAAGKPTAAATKAGTTPASGATAGATAAATDYSGLKGSITVDGSSTVGPLTEAVAEEFGKATKQNVRVTVGISGTGGGFEKFCRGETDINDASRKIKDTEVTACGTGNVAYKEFQVAVDGLSVVVSKDNTWADCLTVAELKAIWDQGSTVNNWNQVRSTFPDQKLTLFGAGRDSGTFDYFTEAINGKAKQSRSDYTASEDDNVTVRGVENDKGAMGYFGFSYYEENKSRMKVLKIDGEKGGGCVEPTSDTVLKNTYVPLSRPLFIYVRTTSLAKPEIKGFVQYYLENTATIAEDVGFIKLPEADMKKGLDALKALQ